MIYFHYHNHGVNIVNVVLTLANEIGGDMEKNQNQPKQTIKSIEIGFRILEVCSQQKGPITLSELSKATGLFKSQIYRYLNTFVNLGIMLRHDDGNPSWSLGPELITLGSAAFASFDLAKEAGPELIKLKNQINETVALSIWRERGPFFLRWEKSNKLFNIGLDTGSYVPLYSATGKIFRAFLPEEVTDSLYTEELKAGNIEPKSYEKGIQLIQEQKLSFSESSLIEGMAAISSPIFYPSGDLAGALSIIGIKGILETSPDSKNVKELLHTVKEVSKKLGLQSRHHKE